MYQIAFLSTAHVHTRGFLNTIRDDDRCTVAAIWDDFPERGRSFTEDYGGDYDDNLAAVVARDDIDGFIICAENTRHLPLLKAAIPTGRPIFCEKPLTTDAASARSVQQLAANHGTVVHLGYFQPFTAEMQGIAALVAAGELGTLTHARYRNAHHAAYGRWFDKPEVSWFGDPELAGGGAFMDMGTHAVHLLRTLLGPARRVNAQINNVAGIYPNVDDNGTAWIEFESGVFATVEASWVQTGGLRGLELTGSEATLYNAGEAGYVYAKPSAEPVAAPQATEKPSRVDRLIATMAGELTNTELSADLDCAVDAVAIMEACYAASETGSWIEL